MSDHPDADLRHVLDCSADFYQSLHAVLGDTVEVSTKRDLLTQGTCSIAIEHGLSVCTLIEDGHLTSAIALLRPQFEAVVRALWLHDVATDDWLERYFQAAKANPMKDPNASPQMTDMLNALSSKRLAPAVRMLQALKDAAWGPMNSYIHSGIHPIVQHHTGFPPEYAIQALRNANGLTGMAATLMAMMTNDGTIATGVRNAQLAHLDCLPPVGPTSVVPATAATTPPA